MSKTKSASKKSPVTPEAFIRAWQSASSLAAAAKSVGLSVQTTTNRASHYRKAGIALKKFPRGGSRPGLDVAKLKKLAASLAK